MADDGGKQRKSSYPQLEPYKWKKGQSGNPSGRAKGAVSLVALIKRRLRENPEFAQAIMDRVMMQAYSGDTRSQELLLNRMDGKLIEHVVQANEIDGWDLTFTEEGEDEAYNEDPLKEGV